MQSLLRSKKSLIILSLVVILLAIFAINVRSYVLLKKSIALNNTAIEIFTDHPKEALYLLDKAISLSPKYKIAYNTKATLLYNLNRVEESLTTYNQLILLDPSLPESYVARALVNKNSGNILMGNEDFNTAIHLYIEQLKKEKNESYIKSQLAFLYFELGKKDDAYKIIADMLDKNPRDNYARGIKKMLQGKENNESVVPR